MSSNRRLERGIVQAAGKGGAMRSAILMTVLMLLAATRIEAGDTADLQAQMKRLLSKVQALGSSAAPAEEWSRLNARLDRLAGELAGAGRADEEVRVRLVQARVLARRLGDPRGAVELLEGVRRKYAGGRRPDLRPVYVALARYLAQCGDRSRIRELITEFVQSPQYDGEKYPYSGGWGREIPLKVVRPRARGADSLTVTAMEKYLKESMAGVGSPCPPFVVVDVAGRRHTRGEYIGRVLLIEFWQPGWAGWRRHFQRLIAAYDRYHSQGLDILSVSYAPRPGPEVGELRRMGVRWPLVYDGRTVAARFGLFGEWGNAVVNRRGVITARDVREGELSRAVREALGL